MPKEQTGDTPKQEKNYTEDIADRIEDIANKAQGIRESVTILSRLRRKKGAEVYDKVAPKLGRGREIEEKFNECGKDLDALIEKYGG